MARFLLIKGLVRLKHTRKCPMCNRLATKRLGKLDFCDDHYKDMRKTHGTAHRRPTAVWVEKHVYTLSPRVRIYIDYLVKIH